MVKLLSADNMKKSRYKVAVFVKGGRSKVPFYLWIDEYTYNLWKDNPVAIKNLLYENLRITFNKHVCNKKSVKKSNKDKIC